MSDRPTTRRPSPDRSPILRPARASCLLLATLGGCATQGWVARPGVVGPDVRRDEMRSPAELSVLVAEAARRAIGLDPDRPSRLPEGPQPPLDDGLLRTKLESTGVGDSARPDTPAPTTSPARAVEVVGSMTAEGTSETIPRAAPPQPIDLPSALRLADRQNPEIGGVRAIILEALASRQAAYGLLLPTLNAGTNYHDHVGVLQRASGTILPVTEQSLYVGSGTSAVGTQTPLIPGVNILSPLTDAIFEPLAAQQRVKGAQANAANTTNVTLLEVARLYLELLGARATYEARQVSAQEADQLAAAVRAFAATGQGRRSDAERTETESHLFQTDIHRAEELMAVTAAQLAERLNLDPSARLQPLTAALDPIELVDPAVSLEDLIRAALARRPDLENRRALVAAAGYQTREEKYRPFLPTVWISFSGGGFGGGSNIVPPTFSAFAGRTDFDARVYWTVLNFGAGNVARVRQRQALASQAAAVEARTINEIRAQVAAARSQSLASRNQVEVARIRYASADDGFAQDRARLRETLVKPIEALDSLRLLAEARVALIEAITDYNQSQFELFVALGAPPPL